MLTNTVSAPNAWSDEELVRQTLAGSEQAWQAVFTRVYACAQQVAVWKLREAGLCRPDHIEAVKLDTVERVAANKKQNLRDFLARREAKGASSCTLDGWFNGGAGFAAQEHIRKQKRPRFGVCPYRAHSGAHRITKGIKYVVESRPADDLSATGVIAAKELQAQIVQPIRAFADGRFTAMEKDAMGLVYDEGLEVDELVQTLNSRPGGFRERLTAETATQLMRKLVERCRSTFRPQFCAHPLLAGYGRRRAVRKRGLPN